MLNHRQPEVVANALFRHVLELLVAFSGNVPKALSKMCAWGAGLGSWGPGSGGRTWGPGALGLVGGPRGPLGPLGPWPRGRAWGLGARGLAGGPDWKFLRGPQDGRGCRFQLRRVWNFHLMLRSFNIHIKNETEGGVRFHPTRPADCLVFHPN